MFVCLTQLRVVIMFLNMSSEAKLLDLFFAAVFAARPTFLLAAASFCASAFPLPFATKLQGGGLLINEVQTRSTPLDRAIAKASDLDTTPSFSPASPVSTTSSALICSLINTAT